MICKITPGSIAEEMELAPGDELISINGTEIEDVFDYDYLIKDENLVVVVRKPDGEEWELDIEKDYDEDLGIEFENGLMDDYRSCSNKCIFCFIDQMPPGMRDTLYFKDDDSRLSFLQGNYVTLTNMKDKDIARIIRYKLAPINISVHTTNPKLRCEMLHNRFAGEALKKIDTLHEAGIEMNGQIVCCKGINDGKELNRTIRDLTKYIPHMQSLSVVPVGLTKYREGLCPLEPFEKEDALEVIAIIEKWQKYCMERFGIHFVHASDEWYLTAGLPLPEEARYDGYIQLENGVGMLRLLFTEFHEALAEYRSCPAGQSIAPGHVTLATGRLAAPFIEQLAGEFMQAFPQRRIDVAAIRNDFFGERITVSGLITAQDLVAQLKGCDLGEYLCIPVNMLKSDEEIFLDDWTIEEVNKALQVPVVIVKSSGQSLLEAMAAQHINRGIIPTTTE
jgi:putative radical SAM enzyme (TIGR03279 family)